jgi:hypothetical protein
MIIEEKQNLHAFYWLVFYGHPYLYHFGNVTLHGIFLKNCIAHKSDTFLLTIFVVLIHNGHFLPVCVYIYRMGPRYSQEEKL